MEQSHFSNLIGLIYDAAQDSSLWPELLDEMHRFMESNDPESNEIYSESKKAMLEPHFQRAIQINRKISGLDREISSITDILNRLPVGVIICEKDAEVVAINKRAKKLIGLSSRLVIKAGKIVSSSPALTSRLHKVITTQGHSGRGNEGESLFIGEQGSNQSISAWITTSTAVSPNSSLVAIYLTSPLIRPEHDISNKLMQQFGLTAAEARVVKCLTNGSHNLNACSEKLGLSIHTVRTQMKSVFEKTGTGNQIELIKRVLCDPGILFSDDSNSGTIPILQHLEQGVVTKLYDGRKLSFCEYGAANGHPVFLFHGIAGSRLQYPADDKKAAELGLRFIVPDRPGYGHSDPKPEHSMYGYVDDISQLADQLGISNFSLLGYTGGCAYAMASAHRLRDRVTTTTLVGGRGPVETFSEFLSVDGIILRMARHTPSLLSKYIKVMLGNAVDNPEEVLEKRFRQYSSVDQAFVEQHPEQLEMYTSALKESLRQGTQGVASDMISVMQPLEFKVEEIDTDVYLWHGEEDRSTPVKSAKKLAEILPNCHATFVPDIGSLVILHKWDDILESIATRLSSS